MKGLPPLEQALGRIEGLAAIDSEAYAVSRLPSEWDDAADGWMQSLLERPKQERKKILATVTSETEAILFHYAYRMSMLAVRRESASLLLRALAAFCIANRYEEDFREVLIHLVLFYRSAQHIGAAPEKLFDQASASVGACRSIVGFFNRSERLRSIECMGWREESGPSGFAYWSGPSPLPVCFS